MKIIAHHLKNNYKTVQKWRVDILNNKDEIPDFLRGRYHQMNTIAKNEALSEIAIVFEKMPSRKEPQVSKLIFSLSNYLREGNGEGTKNLEKNTYYIGKLGKMIKLIFILLCEKTLYLVLACL